MILSLPRPLVAAPETLDEAVQSSAVTTADMARTMEGIRAYQRGVFDRVAAMRVVPVETVSGLGKVIA